MMHQQLSKSLKEETRLQVSDVQVVAKEQEDRIMDISKHHLEISGVASKNSDDFDTHCYISASTPAGSNIQNYLSLSFTKTE